MKKLSAIFFLFLLTSLPHAEARQYLGDPVASARSPASPFDVEPYLDLIKQFKAGYLLMRCPPLMKIFSDPFFTDFESQGLTPGELRDRLDQVIQGARALKLIPLTPLTQRPGDADLDALIAALEHVRTPLDIARQTPIVKDSRLKCAPLCAENKIQCSVQPGLAGFPWIELSPL